MSRRRIYVPAGTLFPESERPAPTYPEYAQLLEDATAAAAADGRFVDPVKLRRVEGLRRDWDWKIAVLGREPVGRALVEIHLLLLADQRDLHPPAPQWLVDARAEATARKEARRAEQKERDDADQAAWDEAHNDCPVELTVHRTSQYRPHRGFSHQLGHAIPAVDCRSGTKRRHRAGRALCESETRGTPLVLAGGAGGPATCKSCLDYTKKIRPAAV